PTVSVAEFCTVNYTYRSEEKAKVQALNDFLVFGTVAATALSSGIALPTVGWRVVNMGVLPAIALVLAVVLWLALRRRLDAAYPPAEYCLGRLFTCFEEADIRPRFHGVI
ncbi:MAG: hypothetical protein O2910_04105, partial [Proteobacteria bacterium]|nr:hypothetical protein [Pseudomonadota bacterium]